MHQGKEPRYGKCYSNRTLGDLRLKILELQINREYQIANPKNQTNLNNQNWRSRKKSYLGNFNFITYLNYCYWKFTFVLFAPFCGYIKIPNSKLVLVIKYWILRFICNLVLEFWDLSLLQYSGCSLPAEERTLKCTLKNTDGGATTWIAIWSWRSTDTGWIIFWDTFITEPLQPLPDLRRGCCISLYPQNGHIWG